MDDHTLCKHSPDGSVQSPSTVQAQDLSGTEQVGRVLRDLLATSKAFFAADHHTSGGLFLSLVHFDRGD